MDLSRMKIYLQQVQKDIKLPDNIKLPKMPDIKLPQMPSLRTPPVSIADSTGPLSPSLLAPATIDDTLPKSNLDLVNLCDSFPYLHSSPELYLRRVATYYHLQVSSHPGLCLGYVLPSVASVFHGLPAWTVDDAERTLVLTEGTDEPSRTAALAQTTAAMRALDHFAVLRGWRDELYPVYGPGREMLFRVERAAASLLGVAQYGAHMTAFVREEGLFKIWVPTRAKDKSTYPGMLDNSVAGGLAAGEEPLDCIVREAGEEAGLPEEMVRERIKAAGAISYFHIRTKLAGGEEGLLEPETEYVYDLDLTGWDGKPKPVDGEAEDFTLMSVEEVQSAMKEGKFKPNCALVLLDFFVRHGILTSENEPDYVQIVSRLHRVVEFPTR